MPTGGAAGRRRVRRLAGLGDRASEAVRRMRGAPRQDGAGLATIGRWLGSSESKPSLQEPQKLLVQFRRHFCYTPQMDTYPGILIALDGIDGAGKTTQVRLLERALVGIGETVVVSKEPTDGEWGQKLRDSALSGRLAFDEELDAFIRDRQDHLKRKVIPALEAGSVVILDRYYFSTIAYQGILVEDYTTLEQQIRADVVVPDAAYWVDLPTQLAVSRVAARDGKPNLFENQDDLAKAADIFCAISAVDPVFRRVDGTLSQQALHQHIISDLMANAFKMKRCAKSYGCDGPVYCTPRNTNTCDWANLQQRLASAI